MPQRWRRCAGLAPRGKHVERKDRSARCGQIVEGQVLEARTGKLTATDCDHLLNILDGSKQIAMIDAALPGGIGLKLKPAQQVAELSQRHVLQVGAVDNVGHGVLLSLSEALPIRALSGPTPTLTRKGSVADAGESGSGGGLNHAFRSVRTFGGQCVAISVRKKRYQEELE